MQYRGYSKLRTRTTLGSYGRAIHRIIGHSYGRCVSLNSSNPCTVGWSQNNPHPVPSSVSLQGYLALKKQPPSKDHHRALGIFQLQGPKEVLFLMSEVPL
jgi:hypothetical protein